MNEDAHAMPIAYRPQALSKEERERARALRTELARATNETTELPNGYAFRYGSDPALFQKAAGCRGCTGAPASRPLPWWTLARR